MTTRHFRALIGLLLFLPAALAQTSPPESPPLRLEHELHRLAGLAEGTVGVSAVHLESGRRVSFNDELAFPMASTYKVPIAVQLLHLVDQGRLRLDKMVTLRESDLHPGSGTIGSLLDDPGVSLSLRNLLELMLLISDNTATDLVLKEAGGAKAVTQRLAELGVEGIRVDRPTIGLIADWAGVEWPPADKESLQSFVELYESVSEERREAAHRAFDEDPRDTATPWGMTSLLGLIWKGKALSPDSTSLLLDIMRRCRTGQRRIKGMLPPMVEVAHKTGTIGRTTNDVGILTLPGKGGHVALSVFVKGAEVEVEQREQAIAQISRAIYDYFLFQAADE